MYLDFSAKVLSLQCSSKEIMFSNVHPRSAGDKLRRLSGPTEFIIFDSLLSIQHILFEKKTLKNSRKNQNQLEVHVGSDEMTFPLPSLSYESFSVSCFSGVFLHSLAVDQTRCHIFQFNKHRFHPRDRQVYSVELSFFGFSRVVLIGNDEAFLS